MATEEKTTSKGQEDPGSFERDVGMGDDAQSSLGEGEDILALQDLDPALNAKMHLVNNVRLIS